MWGSVPFNDEVGLTKGELGREEDLEPLFRMRPPTLALPLRDGENAEAGRAPVRSIPDLVLGLEWTSALVGDISDFV